MEHIKLFEEFVEDSTINEGLRGTRLNDEEANEIFIRIKDYVRDPSESVLQTTLFNIAEIHCNKKCKANHANGSHFDNCIYQTYNIAT